MKKLIGIVFSLCLLITTTCFAEVTPKDLGLTWLTSDNTTGYFVKNVKLSKNRDSIKSELFSWMPAKGCYIQQSVKLDYTSNTCSIYWQKAFRISDGALIAEKKANTIYYVKTGEPIGYSRLTTPTYYNFAKYLAQQNGITFNKLMEKKVEHQRPSTANDHVYNCNVTARMVDANLAEYTCRFPSGNIYKFTARISMRGAFGYQVISGERPPCFIAEDPYSSGLISKLYTAAQNAGWRPPFAG